MIRAFALGLLLLVLCQASPTLVPQESQQYYHIINRVKVKDLGLQSKEETSYTFKVFLKINSVWNKDNEQMLEVTMGEPTVSALNKGNKKITTHEISKIPDRPFYISFKNNKPDRVIAHSSKDQSLLNFKRSIASLFMIQYTDGPKAEIDVSGKCNTFYTVKSSTKIEKIKNYCSLWDLKVNYRSEKPLGVSQKSAESVKYELSADGLLMMATSKEKHIISLVAKPDVGTEITSELVLQHLATGTDVVQQLRYESLDETIASLLDWNRVFDIEADVDGVLSEIKDTSLKHEIAKRAAHLNYGFVGKQELALAMVELLPLARISKEHEFVEVLRQNKKIHHQLVDLLGAAQTFDAFEAINNQFDYNVKKNVDLVEKYYQALSTGTHPDRLIIEHIFAKISNPHVEIKNYKLRDTIIQTMASLVQQSGLDVNDELLQKVKLLLTSNYDECDNLQCKSVYIRAIQNLKDISTIPKLISIALTEKAKVSVLAMEALQSFPITYFTENDKQDFASIFYQTQKRYDSSARAIALEMLFAMKLSEEQLGHLLDYLASNDKQFETKTYLVQKLNMLSDKCPKFKALLTKSLKERPNINNYHIIAQKGLTTVLSRELSQQPAFNESLLSIQEISQGVLKRGSVELILGAANQETSTFKLGIFTSGLSSFMSDDSSEEEVFEEEDDDEDSGATAGMEISVQGTRLRPLVFFNGQTELMSHVWSGTASEPTPAYEATTIAHDHEHYIILSSGATIYYRILGAKSVDLNGKVNLSIWNRNANTEIHQNSGNAIVGHVVVGMTYAQIESKFTVTNEPKLSLQADIDFYSKIKLCMQLQRAEMTLIHSNSRTVSLKADTFYKKSVKTKITHKSAGRTLALNQKNNEMCNIIFN